MDDTQKEYIENNKLLIVQGRWDEFFEQAPYGIGDVLFKADINFLEKLTYVPDYSFWESDIQTIEIPENIDSINSYAFFKCKNLRNVTMFDGVTNVSNSSFCYCTSLTSINIPTSVVTIGDGAFYACSSLNTVDMWDSIRCIEDTAFQSCGNVSINYHGTVDNWKQLISDDDRVFHNTTYTCNCTDGIVKKSR